MFEAEKKGLDLLIDKSGFIIPKPILTGDMPGHRFILMEWVEMQSHGDWQLFGSTLADMHKNTNTAFGLDHQNYIGSLFQDNTLEPNWNEFYINQRLHPLCKKAFDIGQLERITLKAFENLYKRLDEIYPIEPPAFLHGDLWSGNKSFTSDGKPCIYDPAVYFGHREMDLAMTKLFGGFPDEMYKVYHQYYPLEQGWKERVPIGQLYPLLVHVILFGGGYAGQVDSIIRKFG
jgi:fructosamine-3-kinase